MTRLARRVTIGVGCLLASAAGCGNTAPPQTPKHNPSLDAKDPGERGAAAKAAGDQFGAPEDAPNKTTPPAEKPDPKSK